MPGGGCLEFQPVIVFPPTGAVVSVPKVPYQSGDPV